MRLAISNIAWKPEDDDAVASVMREAGAEGVELAPTAYWPDPLVASRAERLALRFAWERRGFPIVALQSLLYGFPALSLFDLATRDAFRERMAGMLDLAADLGAGPLVFGSPRNRARGALPAATALELAVPLLRELGDHAERRRVLLCVEPNPPAYGCDFVTTAEEGRELVSRVGSAGFRLHLDTAGMFLAGDDPAAEAERCARWLGHFHISAPHLAAVRSSSPVDYAACAAALRRGGYADAISIEMRAEADRESRLHAVAEALSLIRPMA